jgi:hypothetical protein
VIPYLLLLVKYLRKQKLVLIYTQYFLLISSFIAPSD